MHPKLELFVAERERARARGDMGVVRSITADLDRYGYREEGGVATVEVEPVAATFAVETVREPHVVESGELPEDEVPAPGRGEARKSRAKPRCEHGKIPGRCLDCEED